VLGRQLNDHLPINESERARKNNQPTV
jgi:hypothetical protein